MIFLLEYCGLVEGLNACTTEIKFFFSLFICLSHSLCNKLLP